MPPRLATSCRLSAWTISWTTPTGFFGTSPSRCDTTKLVAGFCRGGNYGKVSELLHLMIGGDCMPGIFTYHATIRGLGDDFKLRGYAPILVTYTTVIDGLCKMGRRMEPLVGDGSKESCYDVPTIDLSSMQRGNGASLRWSL
ncbi:hypothetical protein B296_00031046 [Ensete ventricosum]|uniref:Pentatricopeptide repeat-containing protein n=1 Tax=Ensete ventricosum TaxID=4639 RepID=A0A427AHA6_ENSVE|nr:hypothetical protein B296_00031046 [Ensete ventricosum]